MILAIIVGTHIEVRYHVLDAGNGREKFCSRPIRVDGLPSLMGSLCGFSEEFRQTLSPGSQIIVEGRGTWLGVFPSRVSTEINAEK